MKFTKTHHRLKALKELNMMKIVNDISEGKKHFAQFQCAFIKRIENTVP